MNLLPSARLRIRLVSIALLAVIPAIALVAYTQWVQRNDLRDRALQNNLNLARAAAGEQARALDGAHRLLLTLAQHAALQTSDPRQCDQLLPTILDENPRFRNLRVTEADGTLSCAAAPADQAAPTLDRAALTADQAAAVLVERLWFDRAMQTKKTSLGNARIGRRSDRPYIVMAHPVLTSSSEVKRIISVRLQLDPSRMVRSQMRLTPGMVLTLFDRNRTILVSYPTGLLVGKQLPEPLVARRLDAIGRDEAIETVDANGVRQLEVTVPIEASLDSGLWITLGVDRARAFAEADRLLKQQLGVLAFVILAVMLAALATSERFVVRPINALTHATARLATGDYSARTRLAVGLPGLTDLADAVDSMATSLEAHQGERERLEAQLRQSQKMEAIGQFAGGVAHDFNNILTAILGYSGLLAEALKPQDPNREAVEEISRAGQRAADLTRQLLAFSRKQILAPRVMHFGDCVGELSSMLRRLIGETIDLKIIASDRANVSADPGQIQQVLMNLVVNARDAMPDGGRLTIETADVMLDDDYARQHRTVQPGSFVMLAVSDTGHGMDATTQSRVFEPFFTTREQGQGTGLGLSTVYGIVKQSGGYISVYSEVGRGTSFKVYLPRTDQAVEAQQAVAPSAPDPRGDETIVLVEDEAMVREFVERILKGYGYTVYSFASPSKALQWAGSQRTAMDLLLTDVILPDMNGGALAAELQRMRPEARVLFTSGYADAAIMHQGVLAPGTAFLHKPFAAQTLIRKVREVLDATRATATASTVQVAGT